MEKEEINAKRKSRIPRRRSSMSNKESKSEEQEQIRLEEDNPNDLIDFDGRASLYWK